MTKAQLAEKVAEKTGLTKKQANKAVDAVFSIITAAISKKPDAEPVSIPGFGKFAVRQRPERTVRNPRTGEPIEKPATIVPVFRAASALKRAVAE